MKVLATIMMGLVLVGARDSDTKLLIKSKRGVGLFGPQGYDFYGPIPSFDAPPWAPVDFASSRWNSPISSDMALAQVQIQATRNVALQALREPVSGTPTIAYPPEILRAIQHAKEANHNVMLAQHRVAEAKEATVIQQKIALAREAAAREATLRSQEIASHAQADARLSTKQLVALQQRLASLKDAVAAAQRVAAARESAAAIAIQKNAADTAAELRKQDADKQIHQSEREAKEQDIITAKEHAIAHAVNHAALPKSVHPWG